MCQILTVFHWICGLPINTIHNPCERKKSGLGPCPISREEVLIDGTCSNCTPDVESGLHYSGGVRIPWPHELEDEETILANWDAAVAMYSPEDQELYGLVLPEDQRLLGIGDQRNLTPASLSTSTPAPRRITTPAPRRISTPEPRPISTLSTQRIISLASQQPFAVSQSNDLTHAHPFLDISSVDHQTVYGQYWNQSVFPNEQRPRKRKRNITDRISPRQTGAVPPNPPTLSEPRDLLEGRTWRLRGEPDDNVPFPIMSRATPMPSSISRQEQPGHVMLHGMPMNPILEGGLGGFRDYMS